MLILPMLAAMAPVADPNAVRPPASTTDWVMLGVYLALAVGVSFLCSLLEAGLLSVSAGYVASLEAEGSKTGKRLAKMKASIDKPLAAILTLNTIAHTVGAAGVGAQSLKIFGSKWVAATSAVVTLIILVFSEIIPKSIGAANANRFAPFTASVVSFLTWSMFLIITPLQWISGFFGGGHKEALSRAEVSSMAEIGLADGALKPEESRVIQNLISLSEVLVSDIMTPRSVAFALASTTTVGQAVEERGPLRFSRIPVFKEDMDHCLGLVTRSEILHAHADGHLDKPVSDFVSPITRVSHKSDVSALLRRMITENEHLALVTDEFGSTDGLVSLEDCLETLLGTEIVDETDGHEDMRELARELMKKRRGKAKAIAPVTAGTEPPAPGAADVLEADPQRPDPEPLVTPEADPGDPEAKPAG